MSDPLAADTDAARTAARDASAARPTGMPGDGSGDGPEDELKDGPEDGPILLVDTVDGVTTLTLNRPRQFNALSSEMLAALQDALEAIDEATRVVVLAARGKAFCAGHDLKEMRAHDDRDRHAALFARCSHLMTSFVALPQPVIAKVQGLATAAGCQLVANADLAIASETARFAVSGIDVGLFCSTPAVPLSRNVARKRAFEMLVTGDFVSARTALEWGLLNRVVPTHGLDAAVAELAATIRAKSAVAVRTGKGLFYEQLERSLADAYALAGEAMADNMMAEDVATGIDAFLGKRAPRWHHR